MAGGAGGPTLGSYSPLTGFIFVFNLIVGAGALTIPHAFAQVGLLYGLLALSLLAMTSYMTATFMIEAIAGANALNKRNAGAAVATTSSSNESQTKSLEYEDGDVDGDSEFKSTTEFMPLMVPAGDHDKLAQKLRIEGSDSDLDFDLSNKMELAQMAQLLFSRNGLIAFYTCVIVYLYGDLAIYAVAVPKSMREIVCPRPSPDVAVWQCTETFNSSELYKLFVVLFGVLLSPFVFGHVHKTRTLQIITTVVRHVSFALMCSLALVGIIRGEGRSVPDVISDEHPAKITTFFGVCIYSFMCHHSIPGLVAPITNKSKVGQVLAAAFLAVLGVYILLCVSATFRFQPEDIDDVYSLNFKNYSIRAVAYFLSLFPVCTLTASFPLICITLRENLRTLAHSIWPPQQDDRALLHEASHCTSFMTRHLYALAAHVPPLVVAFFTEDVSMLVGFTGAYAGMGIQWVVPACLVFSLRRQMQQTKGPVASPNPFASPFGHMGWLYLTFGVALAATVVVTISHGFL